MKAKKEKIPAIEPTAVTSLQLITEVIVYTDGNITSDKSIITENSIEELEFLQLALLNNRVNMTDSQKSFIINNVSNIIRHKKQKLKDL